MLDNEREANEEYSDEARRRANEDFRRKMEQNKMEQAPAGEMNAQAQAGNDTQPADTQSTSERKEEHLPSSERKIEMETASANTIENIQAETINNNNARTVNNNYFLDPRIFSQGFSYGELTFSPLATGKERFKPPERKPEDIELPAEPDKIRGWYLKLKANERCFVQAMAVFQGAPEDEIFQITKQLFEAFQRGKRARQEPQQVLDNEVYGSGDTMIEDIEKWTFCQHIRNADRLFWRDTDKDGVSPFGVAIIGEINNIAKYSVGYSVDQDFLKNLEEWSSRRDGEYGWRAARVLGMIRWKGNQAHFRSKAEQWARSKWTSDWERSANFIYGAFLYEWDQQSNEGEIPAFQAPDLSASRRPPFPGKKRAKWIGTADKQRYETEKLFRKSVGTGHQQSSQVLALLNYWISQAHNDWPNGIGLGYVIAQAYHWIGQKSLQSALDGLQELLEYPFNKQKATVELPILVLVTVVWNYVTLANAGYVYEVMLYLAEEIKDRVFEQNDELSKEQWARRSISLDALLLVFFLLVRLSLSGAHNGTYSRSLKLDNPPALPDTQGRDTLLAAVLSQEEPELRACLVQLFCAAIIEEQEILRLSFSKNGRRLHSRNTRLRRAN